MADQEEDFSHLPITDRAVHKNWKVRKAAFEEAAKKFANSPDEDDPCFSEWWMDVGLWKKVAMDSNVAAQMDGLTALCAFLQYGGYNACIKTRQNTISGIVEKGLTSAKAGTKEKSVEALLLYVELDTPTPVMEELMPFLSHKMAKVIAATVNAIGKIYGAYGAKIVDPKPILKVLPKLFGHADKNVRAETTTLTVELYKWLKDGMKPFFFADLKPAQQKDLDVEFEKVKGESPKQARLLRSQQAAAEEAEAAGDDGGDDAGEPEEEEEEAGGMDAYDLVDPVDVLAKMNDNFGEMIASTKWKDRKDCLDELFKIVNTPKIKSGNYDELVRAFAKSMKDANIAVVTVAAQCNEALAKGLRGEYSKYRSTIMGPTLERLKEKKASVTDALGLSLDAIFASCGLTDILEETLEALKHKNPNVKLETVKFLVRCLKNTRTPPSKAEAKSIADGASKLLGDTSEPVRTSSAEALGTLMKIIGERAMNPYLESLDEIRKTKIKEFFASAVVKAKDKPAPPPPAPKAAPKAGPKKAPGKAPAGRGPPVKKGPAPPQQHTLEEEPAPPKAAPKKAAPSKIGGGLRLQKKVPAPAAAAAPPPSPKPTAPSPTFEEDVPPVAAPKGFGGRTLAPRPQPMQAPPQHYAPPVDNGLTAMERAELEELRAARENWYTQIQELSASKNNLHKEVTDLRIQNSTLIDENTHNNLAIRAKEAQLVRSRADAESAQGAVEKLQREVDRLKRELARSVRPASPTESVHDQLSNLNGSSYSSRDHSQGRNSKRLSFASQMSEDHNGGGSNLGLPDRNRMVSPSSPSGSHFGDIGGRNSPIPTNRNSTATDSSVENWRRAAEVTSALKLRIEQMKRQNFGKTGGYGANRGQ